MQPTLKCLAIGSLAGLVLAAFAACATIIHGTSQDVSIASQPTGAQVIIDNAPLGTTPIVADLKRKDKHTVVIRMEGYEPFELTTTRSTSGWIAGNIVFGGLIGLAVDAITGGMYNIRPETITGSLQRPAGQAVLEDGKLYVFLVKSPEPSWEKIGQLKKVEPEH